MKHLLLFAWLVTIPISVFSEGSAYDHQKFEGIWFNNHYNLQYEIRQHRKDVIKVREGRYGHWKRFERCGKREFVNKRAVIKFINNKTFILKEGRRHKKLKFRKVRGRHNQYGNSSWNYPNQGNYYNDGYGSNDYWDTDNDLGAYNNYGQWTSKEARKRIKGTWKSQSPYAKLRIKTKNDNRIEVKDDRGRKYYYYQDNYRPNEFYNDRGSKYTLLSREEMIWTSKDDRKTVRLFKD
jgi:hypothetical protein